MKQRLSKLLVDMADLPGESIPGQPIVELYGDNRVLIEHHQGILEYGTEQIQIKVRYGALCVQGANLQLCRMQGQQLVIMGCIHRVCLIRGKK